MPVKVYAAGSLREALTDVARAFTESTGAKVELVFGPSGALRDRLAQDERADVFASANMDHPRALAASGRARPARMLARNRLCGLAPRSYGVSTGNLLRSMLDPATRLATSTPKADPAGDYAWQLFERAEKLESGAYEILSRKALQLVGGPSSLAPPADRSVYAMLMAEDKADIFLTYRTNAAAAQREMPSLDIVAPPDALAVFADYGLAVMHDASPEGIAFAAFVAAPAGQGILARSGFAPPLP